MQCSLPALADAYGLYMNTKMLKAAGFTQPPKTLSELTAMAKKLTVRNADGSLKRVGLNPLFGHYETFADGLRAGLRRALVRRKRPAACSPRIPAGPRC